MLHKRDFLWILAYPIYQILGTLRHEGAHALAGMAEGVEIVEFVFWPTVTDAFRWGYVRWYGQSSWFTLAAPYFLDLLTFGAFYLLVTRMDFRRHWVRLNLVIVGLISPFANTLYNYKGIFSNPASDAARLAAQLPQALVHLYFVGTLILYAVGLFTVLRRPSTPTLKLRGATF